MKKFVWLLVLPSLLFGQGIFHREDSMYTRYGVYPMDQDTSTYPTNLGRCYDPFDSIFAKYYYKLNPYDGKCYPIGVSGGGDFEPTCVVNIGGNIECSNFVLPCNSVGDIENLTVVCGADTFIISVPGTVVVIDTIVVASDTLYEYDSVWVFIDTSAAYCNNGIFWSVIDSTYECDTTIVKDTLEGTTDTCIWCGWKYTMSAVELECEKSGEAGCDCDTIHEFVATTFYLVSNPDTCGGGNLGNTRTITYVVHHHYDTTIIQEVTEEVSGGFYIWNCDKGIYEWVNVSPNPPYDYVDIPCGGDGEVPSLLPVMYCGDSCITVTSGTTFVAFGVACAEKDWDDQGNWNGGWRILVDVAHWPVNGVWHYGYEFWDQSGTDDGNSSAHSAFYNFRDVSREKLGWDDSYPFYIPYLYDENETVEEFYNDYFSNWADFHVSWFEAVKYAGCSNIDSFITLLHTYNLFNDTVYWKSSNGIDTYTVGQLLYLNHDTTSGEPLAWTFMKVSRSISDYPDTRYTYTDGSSHYTAGGTYIRDFPSNDPNFIPHAYPADYSMLGNFYSQTSFRTPVARVEKMWTRDELESYLGDNAGVLDADSISLFVLTMADDIMPRLYYENGSNYDTVSLMMENDTSYWCSSSPLYIFKVPYDGISPIKISADIVSVAPNYHAFNLVVGAAITAGQDSCPWVYWDPDTALIIPPCCPDTLCFEQYIRIANGDTASYDRYVCYNVHGGSVCYAIVDSCYSTCIDTIRVNRPYYQHKQFHSIAVIDSAAGDTTYIRAGAIGGNTTLEMNGIWADSIRIGEKDASWIKEWRIDASGDTLWFIIGADTFYAPHR